MPPIPWKLVGGLAGALAVGLLIFALVVKVRTHFAVYEHNRLEAAVLADCEQLAAGKPAQGICRQPVREAVVDAVNARACAAGLAPGKTELEPWAVPLVCAEPVQRLGAAQSARAGEVVSRNEQIARAQADQTAAIDRAVNRGRREAERNANATDTIRNLPRNAAGRSSCDAECLRGFAR